MDSGHARRAIPTTNFVLRPVGTRNLNQGTPVSKPTVLANLLQALVAIILGNVVYFALLPSLPPVARHRPFRLDVGMILDFWFCLVAYGLIRTARKWR